MFQYTDLIWHEPDPDYLQAKVLVRSAENFLVDESKTIELELEQCFQNSYIEKVPEEASFIGGGLCITEKDKQRMELYASSNSEKSKIFEVRVTRCQQRETCKSDDEIEEYLSKRAFVIHSAYTIIDYNDLEEPMQYNVKFPFLGQLSINSGAIIS